METCRSCGCKGIRTCLLCEEKYNIQKYNSINKKNGTYVYCPYCKTCFSGWKIDFKGHSEHSDETIDFPGIYIKLDFLNEDEEQKLLKGISAIPWYLSQSGRRKQNFGPKCNFKKRKIKIGDFKGFPSFSKFVQNKFTSIDILKDYHTIEQCTLEYDSERGASIDPHIDDCWIWGERIVTVNLLNDSVLTMTYNREPTKYNLDLLHTYSAILNKKGMICDKKEPYTLKHESETMWPVVRIPMPRRSLLVMYGPARYEWEHQILREDVKEKRICLAYREFTPPFLEGGSNYNDGKPILDAAKMFF